MTTDSQCKVCMCVVYFIYNYMCIMCALRILHNERDIALENSFYHINDISQNSICIQNHK